MEDVQSADQKTEKNKRGKMKQDFQRDTKLKKYRNVSRGTKNDVIVEMLLSVGNKIRLKILARREGTNRF